jgi:hypothetical protein
VVVVDGDDGASAAAAGEELGAADEGALVFAEVVAAEELIEEEEHEGTRGSCAEAHGANRRDDVALPEVGEDAAADDRAGDADGERGDGPAGVFAGHDGFGQEADEGAEADPDEELMGPERQGFHELGVVHGITFQVECRKPKIQETRSKIQSLDGAITVDRLERWGNLCG